MVSLFLCPSLYNKHYIMKNNFIQILSDSVQLYGNWIEDANEYDVIKSYKKGGLTYKITNDNIKFFAYDDYFYRNAIMSYDLPLTINDVEYSDIYEITDALNYIYPNDKNSGGGGGSIDVDDHLSTLSTNPVENKVVTQALNGKADKSEIPSLDGYATEDWVEEQGYLKEHQDLSEYAKKDEVPTLPEFRTINGQKITGDTMNIVIEGGGGEAITIDDGLSITSTNPVQNNVVTKALNNKANLSDIPSLDGYATESWVLNKNYLTQHQDLSDYAKKTDIPSLTGYATQTWVNNQNFAKNSDIPSLSGYATQTWVNNQNFAKNSDIPSLSGYATQTWVNNQKYLTEHQDISGKQDKLSAGTGIKIENNVVSAKIWQGTKAQYNAITSKDADTIYLIYEV